MVNLKNSHFTHDELKRALKKFKAERDDVQHPVVALIIIIIIIFIIIIIICCFSLFLYWRSVTTL